MIRHIVMFRYREFAAGHTRAENIAQAKAMLEALPGVVPSLRESHVYLNGEAANPENYDLVLVADFDDWQGLQDYIVHPAHQAVGVFQRQVRESRACVDFEL